ncbi:MAG: NAD+ synthase [Phycisphaeraceae bacterium]|nr:MAG: NAD+ synthase [Phycisphaeraceae bacterium]
MRLALAPINPTVGALAHNADLALDAVERARAAGADLLVLPELVICGYPPRDLLFQEGFVEEAERQAARVAAGARGLTIVFGCPRRRGQVGDAAAIANALFVARDGAITDRYDKRLLPTYDVFDEDRYFTPGDRAIVIEVGGVQVGLSVCEDLWRGEDAGVAARYRLQRDPVEDLVAAGARLIVNPSASPFVLGKGRRQRDVLMEHVRRHGVMVAAINQLGGNDELIFDGHALVYAPDSASQTGARLIAAGEPFRDELVIADIAAEPSQNAARTALPDPRMEASGEKLVWEALVLGVRDYCRKTGFGEVVIGLSGGVDSTITACVAAAALGPGSILGVSMPSRFSSDGSKTDAAALAEALGVKMVTAPIESVHAATESLLAPLYSSLGAGAEPGVAEENVQSRIRGMVLMAFANKLGRLVLTTGNKSELAVGYCTLYGDMNGGLAVLADVTKVMVYRLGRWINDHHEACGFARPPIPEIVLSKPPSAELRPDQTDQDSLPPYEQLDEVLTRYVERRQSPARIAAESGLAPELVDRLVRLIDISEYKRRQAAIGLKVSGVAFGIGRRHPIAQGWRPRAGG